MATIDVPGIELGQLLSEQPMRYAVDRKPNAPDTIVEVVPIATRGRREAAIARLTALARVRHRNLASVQRVVRYDAHGYIVISDRAFGRPIGETAGPQRRLEVGIEIAAALAALHDAGFVHGNVCADTIVLTGVLERARLVFPAHVVTDDASPLDDVGALIDTLALDTLLSDIPPTGALLRDRLLAIVAAEPLAAADPVERALIDTLRKEPIDLQTRRVYADWLDEHGDPARAEFLRGEVDATASEDRLLELARPRDTAWRVVVSRAPVACLEFKFACPKRWDALTPTATDGVRHCGKCQREVYFCTSLEQARARGERHECIAIDAGLARGDVEREYEEAISPVMMGEIASD